MAGVVAIVGRANVGKSTIFNRIVGERVSIVEDVAGVTRDRIYATATWLTKEFRLIDTGGIELKNASFTAQIKMQAEIAIEEADLIVFVVNGREGVTQEDEYVERLLQRTKKPILLKRGLSATFEEWIMSAEYIMASGNPNVILCERGIRTFESYTRNTLDLQAIPVVKKLTHLPIIIDPSHAGGKWWLVEPMAKASVAGGADGLMIEVHNDPEKALCDGPQSLRPEKYEKLLKQISKIAEVVGKKV